MFENIIFDFDGTLANTVSSTLNALKKAFYEFDIFCDETKLNERLFVIPRKEVDRLVTANIPSDKLDLVLSRYRALRDENLAIEAHVYPGIKDLLEKLKSNKRRLFIATNSSKNGFSKKLEILFKEIDFDDFRASDGTKPEMVENLISTHDLDKSKTVMVGDGLGDITAGQAVGIKTIAVAWGYEEDKALLKDSADFYVETVEELQSLIKYLNSSHKSM